MGQLFGHPFPAPEYVPLEEAGVIARWLRETIASGEGTVYLRSRVSLGLEVAAAAKREGLI